MHAESDTEEALSNTNTRMPGNRYNVVLATPWTPSSVNNENQNIPIRLSCTLFTHYKLCFRSNQFNLNIFTTMYRFYAQFHEITFQHRLKCLTGSPAVGIWEWGGWSGRTDVFKLAGKVKWRRRGGETSPKALQLSSEHFLVPWPGCVSSCDGENIVCWRLKQARCVQTWITRHTWDKLGDITAPCDFPHIRLYLI